MFDLSALTWLPSVADAPDFSGFQPVATSVGPRAAANGSQLLLLDPLYPVLWTQDTYSSVWRRTTLQFEHLDPAMLHRAVLLRLASGALVLFDAATNNATLDAATGGVGQIQTTNPPSPAAVPLVAAWNDSVPLVAAENIYIYIYIYIVLGDHPPVCSAPNAV